MSKSFPLAKKSFGQNFLHDPAMLAAIAAHCVHKPSEKVIELGAGTGNLTAELAKLGAEVYAIERDRDLVPALRARFGENKRIHIIEADAKKLEPQRLVGDGPYVLCGNIPYQLSAPLLGLALSQGDRVLRVVYMLQKELGQRLRAPTGTRETGALSVLLQQRFAVKILQKVGRGAFQPAPRVDSLVLGLQPLNPPPWPCDDTEALSKLVHAAFHQRRKTLRNALKGIFADPDLAFSQAEVDPGLRAEKLRIQDFVALTKQMIANT